MDRISSSVTNCFPSSKIETISQNVDSNNYNYRNFFRRKFHLNNLWNLLTSSSTSVRQSTPLLLSLSMKLAVSKKHIIKNAVLVLTILLGLIQNSLSSPVFVDNPSIAQFQSGRNIRHLPCIVRKSGLSGTCMFAIDCIKQNGTHLGTCIDRFYFGSCCRIKDDYFAQDINDNSIDQNTISHFLNDVNTTPNTISSYKPTIQQEENSQHKSKPTLPVPYVPISTVIPSMQNRENSVNSSSLKNEIPESNSLLLNNPKIEILSSSQTSSVSISSSSSSSSSPSQKIEKPLNVAETLAGLNTTVKSTIHTTQSPQSNLSLSSSSILDQSSSLSSQTIEKQSTTIPTKPIKITNKPTSTIKQTSTHKTSPTFTTANEVLKETNSASKITITHPTKLTYNTKHTSTKQSSTLGTTLTTTTKKVIKTNPTNKPTKPSTLMIPLLTTSYPIPLMAENHIKETTESVKFTTFQMVETTTFTPTRTTPTTKMETKKPPATTPTKSPAPIIYVSNKPLYTKRPLTTHRTKGTKRPVKPINVSSTNVNRRQPTTTSPLVETTIKIHSSKKPVIVTKKPLSTRPPITKPTGSLATTVIPSERPSPTKRPDSYKTDTITTANATKIPLVANTIIQTTKAPRPKPKPTAEIVRVSPTSSKPIADISTMKVTTFSSVDNVPQVNISLTTTKSELSPSSTSTPLLHLHTTKYHTSSITSISSTQITTTISPSTTLKPLSSSSHISTLSTSSFKQSTTKQPSSKPPSTRFPSRPTITRQPSTPKPSSISTTSSTLTTKIPLPSTNKTTSTTNKPNSSTITKSSTTIKPSTSKLPIVTKHPLTTKPSTSKLPIVTKHPLTTKPPIITTSIPTTSSISISLSPSTTPLQAIITTTTTMKPSALVTWTNVDNTPQTNNSGNINPSDKNNDDWQPKPYPEWVVKPSISSTTELNKMTPESTTSNLNASEPTTEDIIASSISSVLDQLNNQTTMNITNNFGNTTDNPWVWTTESKLNVSSTLSTTMEGLANISNATFANGEGFNNVSSSTTPTIPSLEGIDYKQICGKRMYPEPRIVGGANAAFGRWPWQISLRQWRTSTYLHKCGAALLNENWAITAAHCVDNVPPSDLLLRLGEYDLAEEEEPYSYQERRVQIVASHPQFDPRTFEYDLALLRFYEPVLFQPNIIPVCVPDNDYDFLGQTAYVTGWGRLYEDGPLPSVLQEVSVPVINNTICETMYRAAGYIEHIPHIFICAGWKKGGYDSCEGDSGGPMVLQRERDKRFVLGGVISWGIGCAEPNQPGVYTRISEFRDWINQILQF